MNKTNRSLQLEKIERVENRLKARKQKIINGMRSDQRKEDTRRKILLGSIMMKAASENESSRNQIKSMVAMMSDRDKKVFETLFESWADQQ